MGSACSTEYGYGLGVVLIWLAALALSVNDCLLQCGCRVLCFKVLIFSVAVVKFVVWQYAGQSYFGSMQVLLSWKFLLLCY